MLAVALGLAAGTTLLSAPAESRERRWPPQKWMRRLSQPRYETIVSTTEFIEAADGTQLSLTVHLPDGLPDDEKIPTLLQITPYQPLYQSLGEGAYSDYFFFVRRGAAYVEADARGTAGSEGCLDFGGSADRSDAGVFVNWIRKQPWSNGRVVTDGVSHPGMGSVVAHVAAPRLTGALAHAPVVSYYQDEWLQGAKFEDQINGPGYQAFELLPPQYQDPRAVTAQAATCTGTTLLDYSVVDGPFTEYWADRDLSRHVPKRAAPILLTHGFVDQNVHPDHSQLYWDALPEDYPKYAIFGWWYHGYPDMTGHPFLSFDFLRHRWLDTLLFGINNGLWLEPRVLVEDSLGTWHEGNDWPLEESEEITLFPGDDGRLQGSPGTPGSVTYTDRLGAARGTWIDGSAVFRSAPLKTDRLVNGAPAVDLVASSTADATKWVTYLLDEAPDGSWERISHGYADSHTWKSEEEWLPMAPGQAYRWQVHLLPTAVVVKKGHRVVLLIASQDSRNIGTTCFSDYRGGCYAPSGIVPAASAGRAENTVIVGHGKTSVRFDWVDPNATSKPPWSA